MSEGAAPAPGDLEATWWVDGRIDARIAEFADRCAAGEWEAAERSALIAAALCGHGEEG